MESAILLTAAVSQGLTSVLSLAMPEGRARKVLTATFWSVAAGLTALATGLLLCHLASRDFAYSYVANHTSRDLATTFRLSALWAGQEGSFLLWMFIMSVMGFAVLRMRVQSRGRVFGIYSAVSCSIAVMCYLSQPFARLAQVPADGAGLAKALQDPWMVVHPPLVFVGYTAMAVLLAHLGGLSKGQESGLSRQFYAWMRFAWVFLGLGILTGSVWAYRALGWGGYWAWDPIENAALVPWLVMCGYLHTKTRPGRVRCLMPFALAIAGTFLTRSGILKERSAHAYTGGTTAASELMAACLIGAVGYLVVARFLEAWRPKAPSGAESAPEPGAPASQPVAIFALTTYVYAALIMAGTWAPLLVAYNTPVVFYNAISVIYALACTALLLVHNAELLRKRAAIALVANTLVTMGLVGLLHMTSYPWLLLFWVCLLPLWLYLTATAKLRGRFWLLHTGVVLMIAGAIASSTLGRESLLVSPVSGGRVEVAGRQLQVSNLAAKETVTVVTPLADYIVDCRKVVSSEGQLLMPTTTKPLITLFWAGGFVLIGYSVWTLVKRRA